MPPGNLAPPDRGSCPRSWHKLTPSPRADASPPLGLKGPDGPAATTAEASGAVGLVLPTGHPGSAGLLPLLKAGSSKDTHGPPHRDNPPKVAESADT